MKIVVCWPHISGYMSACWRALAARRDVNLSIIGFKSNVTGLDIKFQDEVVAGLTVRLLSPEEAADAELVRSLVVAQQPDVVVLPGWAHAPYRTLVDVAELRDRARFVMTMDTPYRGTLRQKLGRFKVGGYLDRIDRVVVAGERAWQLARVLRIPEAKIRRGLYSMDYNSFAPALERRRALPGGWPRRFLFVGRYHEDKGIEVLLGAYRAYRTSVPGPWGLTCCGTGPLKSLVEAEVGVTDRGFVQPADQPPIFAEHGVFVLSSLYEPWGVVIAEAAAAGLPVIHTEACGAAVEIVRPYFNGVGVATGNVEAMSAALRWCHLNHDKLPEMGARGQPLAAPFGADAWADRWEQTCRELTA